MKKKSIALCMALAMVGLTACSGSQKPAQTTAAPAETTAAQTEAASEAEETSEEASEEEKAEETGEEVTILVAAAASLKYSYDDELIPMFEKANPGIKVEATYDSSGKLQTQIDDGLDADVFMSSCV